MYGLPEVYGDEIAAADLVANPGCYPTATLLALAPLARSGTVADVVIDAKSGVSGAGRAPSGKTHFVTVTRTWCPTASAPIATCRRSTRSSRRWEHR